VIRSILIDDEARSIKTLQWQLAQYCPEVEIIGSYDSAAEGMAAIREKKPDLVFLDIEMPNMGGFEMLERLQPLDFAIIFTTAYDRFALKAFRYSAVDYLLKPIDKDDLCEAVSRVKKDHGKDQQARIELLLEHLSGDQPIRKIVLSTLDSFVFVDIADIIYCESERNYTRVFLKEGKNIVVAKTLKLVEELISSRSFFRAHHSFLINLNNIKQFKKEDGGYIVMSNDASIPISRTKREEFFALFSKL